MVSQERVDRSLANETAAKDLGIEHLAIYFGCSLHALNLTSHQHNREYFPEKIGDVHEELINTALGRGEIDSNHLVGVDRGPRILE